MSKTIRAFIAVDLNPTIKRTIEDIQNHLKKSDCAVKWVRPENIHLTLKFLGDVNIKKINSLIQTLADLFCNTKPIETQLTQLGAFPNIKRPRVLWVGLKDDKQNIVQLARSLEENLGKIGFQKDQKPFSPHITIGRLPAPKNIQALTQAISSYTLPPAQAQTVQQVILYKSTLTSQYPIYKKLAKFDFHSSYD
jgi:2'-5' RNA ligase